MNDREKEPSADRSRSLDKGVLAIGGCLVLLVLSAGAGGGMWLFSRFYVPDSDEPHAELTPYEVETTQVAPPERLDPALAMGPRYRPGPHVRVEGLLPSGLATLRRMGSGQRGGRTIDNPWIVAGAELRPGAPPSSAGGAVPSLTLQNGNTVLSLVAGAPATLPLHASAASAASGPDSELQGLMITFEHYPGYFFLPAITDTELGQIRVAGDEIVGLQFGIDALVLPGGGLSPAGLEMKANIRIAAVDMAGNISPWRERQLEVIPLGTGDLEVALTMTESTDLDLYVVDPSGAVTYYGNTSSGSGGHLDLDANAGCGGQMGVNAEHVFFPRGQAPAGIYQVRVANYSSCISGRQVDYRITVRNCGETAVLSGSFVGQGDSRNCTTHPQNDVSWCQQVVTFDVTPCAAQ